MDKRDLKDLKQDVTDAEQEHLRQEGEQLRTMLERTKAQMSLRAHLEETNELTDRERRLIANCKAYAAADPAGLPGHNLMLIVAKLAKALGL